MQTKRPLLAPTNPNNPDHFRNQCVELARRLHLSINELMHMPVGHLTQHCVDIGETCSLRLEVNNG